jgi:uncharacterized protein involved in tellurium resistance
LEFGDFEAGKGRLRLGSRSMSDLDLALFIEMKNGYHALAHLLSNENEENHSLYLSFKGSERST